MSSLFCPSQKRLKKDKKEDNGETSEGADGTSTSTESGSRVPASTAVESDGVNAAHLQQLIDMGFSREASVEARPLSTLTLWNRQQNTS